MEPTGWSAIRAEIEEAIDKKNLPKRWPELFDWLVDSEGCYQQQENVLLDYKEEFPFSHSNDYFGGIARLVAGFYNTFGGLIIFGVHDEKRTAGHNKVRPAIEKFNQSIRQYCGANIECVYRTYDNQGISGNRSNSVGIALIPKRAPRTVPAQLQKTIGKYKLGSIYFRAGDEVRTATTTDLPFIYSPRLGRDYTDFVNSALDPVDSFLPQNPSNLVNFIGRDEVMKGLWDWYVASNSPRMFLWGRGGSGKSTIAYRFAEQVRGTGGTAAPPGSERIDYVIYLSAKERELDTKKAKISDDLSADFSTAEELFEEILWAGGWLEPKEAEKLSRKELVDNLCEFLSTFTVLLIIDDIDTLTVKRTDTGMEDLFRCLSRSDSGSKAIYTLRNLPGYASENSIEVPGLDQATEYPEFVATCCEQFKQPQPNKNILLGKMDAETARIPLAVETLIGLRRTSGSYEKAIKRFAEDAGSEPRKYMFEREYLSLPQDNRARHLLAALRLFGKPVDQKTLEAVLQFDEQQLGDAIGDVYEMFLEQQTLDAETTIYSLNPVTSRYISEISPSLDRFEVVKQRVQNFVKGKYPGNPVIRNLVFEIERLLRSDDAKLAAARLESAKVDPKISEDPRFRILRAKVLTELDPSNLPEIRRDYNFCANMGYAEEGMLRDWYRLEKMSGVGLADAIKVCDFALKAKGVAAYLKPEFRFKRALAEYALATEKFQGDIEKSKKLFEEALMDHIRAYLLVRANPRMDISRNEQMIQNTTRNLVHTYCYYDMEVDFFQIIRKVHKSFREFPWDLWSSAIHDFIRSLPYEKTGSKLNRLRNDCVWLVKQLTAPQKGEEVYFVKPTLRKGLCEEAEKVAQIIQDKVKVEKEN